MGEPPSAVSPAGNVGVDSAPRHNLRGVAVAVAALCLGVAYFYWDQARQTPRPSPPTTGTSAIQPPSAAAPAIRHPIEVPGAPNGESAVILPALEDSDTSLRNALASLIGEKQFGDLVYPDGIVRRIVATIDNLPRSKAPLRVWPVKSAPGSFIASGAGSNQVIDAANAARYTAYVNVVRAVDARTLVDLYRRLYPLFQRAHEELGYPHGYFNDRVIETIDDLLDAPEPKGPIKLTQSKVLFEFADPQLEARSAGQKLMIRIGPANAAKVKSKLLEIHDEILRHEVRK
ncbi:MAG: DUF3014 domain-containing protein [Casimicrobiaceae bacterium]